MFNFTIADSTLMTIFYVCAIIILLLITMLIAFFPKTAPIEIKYDGMKFGANKNDGLRITPRPHSVVPKIQKHDVDLYDAINMNGSEELKDSKKISIVDQVKTNINYCHEYGYEKQNNRAY